MIPSQATLSQRDMYNFIASTKAYPIAQLLHLMLNKATGESIAYVYTQLLALWTSGGGRTFAAQGFCYNQDTRTTDNLGGAMFKTLSHRDMRGRMKMKKRLA